MGKEFICKDMGMDCDTVLHGETEEILMPKIVEHVKEAHNITEIDEATAQKVQSVIHDV